MGKTKLRVSPSWNSEEPSLGEITLMFWCKLYTDDSGTSMLVYIYFKPKLYYFCETRGLQRWPSLICAALILTHESIMSNVFDFKFSGQQVSSFQYCLFHTSLVITQVKVEDRYRPNYAFDQRYTCKWHKRLLRRFLPLTM